MTDVMEKVAAKVRDHISRHLPSALNTDAEVTEVRAAGHHVRAHAVADVRTSAGGFQLFLKLVKPVRKEAELFAYDRLLPTALCSSPEVIARFPDWEWPTVWLALEFLKGRWASPALDLGNVLAHVDMEFHRGCAETYRTQLSSHGVEVEMEKVGEWIRMGLCHDALNTFCYAVDRKREGRFGPNDDWFSTWGMPRVSRLREIRDG